MLNNIDLKKCVTSYDAIIPIDMKMHDRGLRLSKSNREAIENVFKDKCHRSVKVEGDHIVITSKNESVSFCLFVAKGRDGYYDKDEEFTKILPSKIDDCEYLIDMWEKCNVKASEEHDKYIKLAKKSGYLKLKDGFILDDDQTDIIFPHGETYRTGTFRHIIARGFEGCKETSAEDYSKWMDHTVDETRRRKFKTLEETQMPVIAQASRHYRKHIVYCNAAGFYSRLLTDALERSLGIRGDGSNMRMFNTSKVIVHKMRERVWVWEPDNINYRKLFGAFGYKRVVVGSPYASQAVIATPRDEY